MKNYEGFLDERNTGTGVYRRMSENYSKSVIEFNCDAKKDGYRWSTSIIRDYLEDGRRGKPAELDEVPKLFADIEYHGEFLEGQPHGFGVLTIRSVNYIRGYLSDPHTDFVVPQLSTKKFFSLARNGYFNEPGKLIRYCESPSRLQRWNPEQLINDSETVRLKDGYSFNELLAMKSFTNIILFT